MTTTFRKPAVFAAGFIFTILIGSAARAQTPAGDVVQRSTWITSILEERSARPFAGGYLPYSTDGGKTSTFRPVYIDLSAPISAYGPRPRACFCDEDCYADLLKNQKQRTVLFPEKLPSLVVDSEIRVIDLEGLKKVLQRDANDKRPLLLNFWATWCDPCREEFPDLVKLDADYKKALNFIAVSLDDITDVQSEVPKFLNQMKATMPVVLLNVKDPEPAIKIVDPTWDGQLPATFLYDKDGRVVFKHYGKIKPDELRAAIDKQISANK